MWISWIIQNAKIHEKCEFVNVHENLKKKKIMKNVNFAKKKLKSENSWKIRIRKKMIK